MEQAGGTGELVNAPGLGKEAVGEGHHGPEVNGGRMRSPLGLFGLDGKSRVGNLIDVGEQPFEPKGADFLLWGLVSLGMGGGTLPSPAQDFKRQSHDRSRGSTCSSQVQGQSARIKAGLGTASLAPRPSPPAANSPHARVCLPKDQVRAAGGRVTCHGSGLGRGGDECRQKTQAK